MEVGDIVMNIHGSIYVLVGRIPFGGTSKELSNYWQIFNLKTQEYNEWPSWLIESDIKDYLEEVHRGSR